MLEKEVLIFKFLRLMSKVNFKQITASNIELNHKVVAINRVAKVTKGGRTFSFSVIVVVGDGNGIVARVGVERMGVESRARSRSSSSPRAGPQRPRKRRPEKDGRPSYSTAESEKHASCGELYSRPQSDRMVIRNGEPIDTTLPDYAELDHLMRT